MHRRESYIIFDVLGDLGGVIEILVFLFGIFLLPVSEYSFNMSAISRLYYVKSKDHTEFFDKQSTLISDIENRSLNNSSEDKTYENPKLSTLNELKLFTINYICCCFKKLYRQKGIDKIYNHKFNKSKYLDE